MANIPNFHGGISDRVLRILGLDRRQLADPHVLATFADRVPSFPDWPIDAFQDPRDRGNLLLHIRGEKLPHPVLQMREAIVRESYLEGNHQLINWVYKMIWGCVPDPSNNPRRTERCSACTSSFMGYPLRKHSENECGFVRFLPDRFKLDFAIANSHAFCGFCNSRSTSHTSCGRVRECLNCGRAGHQHYHGVCNTDIGRSFQLFKEEVQKRRHERMQRIRYLAQHGNLGFPIPTDYVPERASQGVYNTMRRGETIRGTGILIHRDVFKFFRIPDNVYRWKCYPGLVNVEIDPKLVLLFFEMTNQEARSFMRLEDSSRELYHRRRRDNIPYYLLMMTMELPRPRYPADYAPPGFVRDEADHVQNQVPVEFDEEDRAESPDNNVLTEQDVQEYVEQSKRLAPTVPSSLSNRVRSLTTAPSFAEKVEKMLNLKRAYERNHGEGLGFHDCGKVVVENPEYKFEFDLLALIKEECAPFIAHISGRKVLTGMLPRVIETMVQLEAPTEPESCFQRICSWQVLLAGSHQAQAPFGNDALGESLKYLQFLCDLATAIGTQPRIFTSLHEEGYTSPTSSFVKGIPVMNIYLVDSIKREIDNWKAASAERFMLFNVHPGHYPLEYLINKEENNGAVDEDVEIENETLLSRMVIHLDTTRALVAYRLNLPKSEAMEQLRSRPIPRSRRAMAERIATIGLLFSDVVLDVDDILVFETHQLSDYLELWDCMLQVLRCVYLSGGSAPMRLSTCMIEVTSGTATATEIIIPALSLSASEFGSFWKGWVHTFFVPMAFRVTEGGCSCPLHEAKVHIVEEESDDEEYRDQYDFSNSDPNSD